MRFLLEGSFILFLATQSLVAVAEVSTFTSSSETSRAELPHMTEGFYPIWESTGSIESHRKIYIGSNGAHMGIRDRVQFGVQPVYFMYRIPNGNVKVLLHEGESTSVTAQISYYRLMEEASRAFLSPMYTSRLDNPDFTVHLVPVSLASTTHIGDWLDLHQSVTALSLFTNGPLNNEVNFGYSATAEFLGRRSHSILLHGGEVGFWRHDFSFLGTSYRYRGSTVEFRLGYFYRMRPGSQQSGPLIALGFNL